MSVKTVSLAAVDRTTLFKEPEKQKPLYEKWQGDYLRIFLKAGLDILSIVESPNRYCGDECCPHLPAVAITTRIGVIEFWWRKRVCVLEWSRSDCKKTSAELFPDTTDTSDPYEIHCWGYESALTRLKKINEEARR